ncbi:hypothetical protein HPB50_003472 [Hyalomma asiaticum]|uniref:Uncharacterized protein n=1 Tax=Hyalomma asiaticum TaxID=266040 RepID=A0ACB7RX26_HYAAI|nr:hypothetical protein HPB50_003472 [Hyalomma asiaticum]
MVRALEGALFGCLVLANLSLGLYFSLRKRNTATTSVETRNEVFLASRMLKTLPLAASSVASLFSSTGLVGFPAHYYTYGWHISWGYLMTLATVPLATHVFVPVLYRLRITSIFEASSDTVKNFRTHLYQCNSTRRKSTVLSLSLYRN